MVEYRKFGTEYMDAVMRIYEEAGWKAYLGDEARLRSAFEQSLCVIGAFEDGRLLGFLRCVGDGAHVVYVQDLIVAASARRKGIGRELMRMAMTEYCRVRMFTLVTDANDEAANGFYRAIDMRPYESCNLAGYIR